MSGKEIRMKNTESHTKTRYESVNCRKIWQEKYDTHHITRDRWHVYTSRQCQEAQLREIGCLHKKHSMGFGSQDQKC